MIIKEGSISSSNMEVIDKEVMGMAFPWYYSERSTTTNFPFFMHILVEGKEKIGDATVINSTMFPLFEGILTDFCRENGIVINEILRGCLNLTHHSSVHDFGDPHVDYPFEIWQVLMYLNEFSNGETLVFSEEYDGSIDPKDYDPRSPEANECHIPISESSDLKVKETIVPEKGKIVGIHGKNYHSAKWCLPSERRIVCVFSFI
mgnify:FL=1